MVWRERGLRESEKFPTAEQAERYRQLVTANGARRVLLTPSQASAPTTPVTAPSPCWTFAAWARYWCDTYSGPRETTLVRYRSMIERDLIPFFGALDITESH
jgi:hypothetical protein